MADFCGFSILWRRRRDISVARGFQYLTRGSAGLGGRGSEILLLPPNFARHFQKLLPRLFIPSPTCSKNQPLAFNPLQPYYRCDRLHGHARGWRCLARPDAVTLGFRGESGDNAMSLNWKQLVSSNIGSAAYNGETHELHVKFKSGAHYVYSDVSHDEADDFFSASSHGKHHNEELTGVKKHRRVG